MQALRQFHKPENGVITVQLPANFDADEVEVIILPKAAVTNGVYHQADHVKRAIGHFLSMDTTDFTSAQLQAYQQNCERLRVYQPGGMPIYDLYKGLVEFSTNVAEPLPDDITDLFYGSETDEYGMSLQR